jgi:NAD(P)-dependent dehydrogenase (short-subunit alcohol dehydrogenase family)
MASRKSGGTSDVGRQRKVQAKLEAKEKKGGKGGEKKKPIQTGARDYPGTPLPKQRQRKPGLEADIEPRPMYDNPAYRGSGKLEGMRALITGGDSGIGRAVAVFFAREGASVAIVYLASDEDAAETVRVIEEDEGGRCLAIKGDVSNPKFCAKAVKRTVDAFGGLDILVNNAAFQQHAQSLEQITDEQFDLTFKTNIYGYFHMTKAALPHLGEKSSIVNTTSETALFGHPEMIDYASTKGAINAFTMSLSASLIERGIRVNGVAPGPVWTPLNPADADEEKVAQFGAGTALHRPAQPEEVAPAYVFLASPVTGSFVNGVILPVMGGTRG